MRLDFRVTLLASQPFVIVYFSVADVNVAIASTPPSLLNLPPKIKRLASRGLEPLSPPGCDPNVPPAPQAQKTTQLTDTGHALLRIDYPFED